VLLEDGSIEVKGRQMTMAASARKVFMGISEIGRDG
jgi:hypothetical protein